MTTLVEVHRQSGDTFLSVSNQRAQRQLARGTVLVAYGASQ